MKRVLSIVFHVVAALALTGCATSFPRPDPAANEGVFDDGLDGPAIFAESLQAHGGDLRESAEEVQMAVVGEWGRLIKRIQPLVTDYGYRIGSEETLQPDSFAYAVRWTGPDGIKTVERRPGSITVQYDGADNFDEDVLASSAMTADAFQLFHFGPNALVWRGAVPTRLADYREKGRDFYQLHFWVRPGFGKSSKDEAVLLVDKQTGLVYRVWITLEGFRTTRGASVDVTFTEYSEVKGFMLPSRFVERVRAPISIFAHRWHVVSRDVILKP